MRPRANVRRYRSATCAVCAAALLTSWAALPTFAAPADGTSDDDSGDAAALAALQGELAEVRAHRDTLHDQVDAAIDTYLDRAEELELAEEAAESAAAQAAAAEHAHEGARDAAAGHAAAAYQGSDLGLMRAWSGADGLTAALERGGMLQALARDRAAVVERAAAAATATDVLRQHAENTEEEARGAEEQAAEAREEIEEALAEQEASLEELLDEQGRIERRMAERREGAGDGPADGRRLALEGAEAADPGAAEGAAQAAPPGEAEGGEGAACTGEDLTAFENGRIPSSALCPLAQPGHLLRADAAAAFLRLEEDYRDRFGRAMCVAESYRPLSEQVRLFATMKPGMAARPGTSAHGQGIAVDLCGGVERRESAEHAWMRENAPAHGWHNPPWAQDGFEPWHWEYEGGG